MSIIQGTGGGLGGAGDPGGALASSSIYSHTLDQSLRVNQADDPFLSHTHSSSADDEGTCTISVWVKRSKLGATTRFMGVSKGTNYGYFGFDSTDKLSFFAGNPTVIEFTTNRLFRDPSAWYHIVVALDIDNSTSTQRFKMYVNGVQETSFATATYPSSTNAYWNEASAKHSVGCGLNSSGDHFQEFDGYIAEVNFIDGVVLDPSSFGETKDGVWVSKDYSGSYGDEGFHLTFQGTGTATTSAGTTAQTNIGDDQSGNGNNFEIIGSSIVASDVVPDSPTNNFSTMNALQVQGGSQTTPYALSEGNLKMTSTANNYAQMSGAMGVQSGKWYTETYINSAGYPSWYIGWTSSDRLGTWTGGNNADGVTTGLGYFTGSNVYIQDFGDANNASTVVAASGLWSGGRAPTTGDIIGCAVDFDNRKIWWSINGEYVNIGSGAGDPANGTNPASTYTSSDAADDAYKFAWQLGYASTTKTINFGQDSTFAGNTTAGGNADDNGVGDFKYAPPSGFLALCSANLTEPTIGPNSTEQADDYFETILYTGNGAVQHIGSGGAQHPQDTTTIANSVILNGSDEELTARSPSSAGNQKTWTWSAWVKRSELGTFQTLFSTNQSSNDATAFNFGFTSADKLVVSPWNNDFVTTSATFEDTSKFYHILLKFDTTQSGSNNSDRIAIYVDGVEQALVNGSSTLSYDTAYAINQTEEHRIGNWESVGWFFGGYLAEVNFVDGTAYDADTFGQVGSKGYWIPKALSGISYGTNGFRLTFQNSSYLGYDYQTSGRSGTTNDFTPTGLAATDQVIDSPTQNFATLSPSRVVGSPTLSEGNLKLVGSGTDYDRSYATLANSLTSGKWYAEFRYLSGDNRGMFGVVREDSTSTDATNVYIGSKANQYGIDFRARSYTNSTELFDTTDFSTGDIGLLCFDIDNNKLWFGRRDISGATTIWYDSAGANNGDPSAGTNPTYTGGFTGHTWLIGCHDYNGTNIHTNFGADGSFSSGITSNGLSDANGFGDFNYIEDGFLALVDDNIPQEGIASPDWVWIKERNGTANNYLFDTVRGATKNLHSNATTAEATDANSLLSFGNQGFTIGSDAEINTASNTYASWTWKAGGISPTQTYTVKVVSDSGNKYRFDDFGTSAVTLELQEGGTYTFDQSDSSNSGHPLRFSTTSDGTHGSGSEYTVGVTTTGTPGSAGAKTVITVAHGAPTLYYYCSVHSGMGGQANTTETHGSSNFKGSIQSVVSAAPDAGFSIVTWDALGFSTGTVGHGLTVAPDIIIAKARDHDTNWFVQVPDVLANTHMLNLETTGAAYNPGYNHFNDTVPTDEVFSIGGYLGNHSDIGNTNTDKIAYCFHSVDGYSKIGSYVGNGSAGGTFVYTGFRPAFLLLKKSSAGGDNWSMYDNKRDVDNVVREYLIPNTAAAAASTDTVDFLSNGFKVRNSGAYINTSGATYIYLAFAEQPFKYANAR